MERIPLLIPPVGVGDYQRVEGRRAEHFAEFFAVWLSLLSWLSAVKVTEFWF